MLMKPAQNQATFLSLKTQSDQTKHELTWVKLKTGIMLQATAHLQEREGDGEIREELGQEACLSWHLVLGKPMANVRLFLVSSTNASLNHCTVCL